MILSESSDLLPQSCNRWSHRLSPLQRLHRLLVDAEALLTQCQTFLSDTGWYGNDSVCISDDIVAWTDSKRLGLLGGRKLNWSVELGCTGEGVGTKRRC